MPNQDLQQYIDQSRQQGKSDEQIRQELLGEGWGGEEINSVLKVYGKFKFYALIFLAIALFIFVDFLNLTMYCDLICFYPWAYSIPMLVLYYSIKIYSKNILLYYFVSFIFLIIHSILLFLDTRSAKGLFFYYDMLIIDSLGYLFLGYITNKIIREKFSFIDFFKKIKELSK